MRLVVIAPDLLASDEADAAVQAQFERSRQLRIGLPQGGFQLVATLPADTYLSERLGQLQPDMIIVDAESGAAIRLNKSSWRRGKNAGPSCCHQRRRRHAPCSRRRRRRCLRLHRRRARAGANPPDPRCGDGALRA